MLGLTLRQVTNSQKRFRNGFLPLISHVNTMLHVKFITVKPAPGSPKVLYTMNGNGGFTFVDAQETYV